MTRIYTLIIVLLLITTNVFAQNISGVINSYAAVTAINLNVLSVTTTTGFSVGDKVLIIKMKGAQVNQANTVAYGDTTSLDESGKYTFSNVIALTNNTLTLSPFCNIFANTQYLQVVKVPIYPNPTVNATLTCQAWDGSTGGVLIFETPGTLTLNANIDISHLGYRGGDVWGNTFSCGTTNFFSAQAFFGPEGKKGEGYAEYIVGQECGRGKLANGGGGAFGGNGGAAGGANAGKGGDGGFEYNGCAILGSFAYGGQPVQHVNTALFMGGGGGGPQSDNAQQVYNGGNGGGIIFITANQIVGNGNTIHSNGQTTPTINDEGASGGGAGGSIYVNCSNFTGPLTFSAIGGNGGSNNNVIFAQNCHGPGGGGGGGLVWFSTPNTPAGVTVATQGGSGGFVLNPTSTCYNTQYNAGDGNPGLVNFNFVPTPPPVLPTVNLGPDGFICSGSSVTFDAGPNYASYLWDDNSNGQIRTVNTVGTFYVTVTTQQGCTASDTVNVFKDTSVVAGFNATIKLGCIDDTIQFVNTSVGATQYQWNFGDGVFSSLQNPTHVYTNQGNYVITLIAGNPPCFDTITFNANLDHPINAGFTARGLISGILNGTCFTDPIEVDANGGVNPPLSTPSGFITYSWDWGDGQSLNTGLNPITQHVYSTPGYYKITLTITDTLGCTDTASTVVYVDGSPFSQILASDSVICIGDPINFTGLVSSFALTTFWDFGDGVVVFNDTTQTHTYDAPNNYIVTLGSTYAICPTDSVQMLIKVDDYPSVHLGPDTSICPGLNGSLFISDIINPNALHLWSTGETSSGITVTEPGVYWVQATTQGSNCSSVDSIWVKRDCYLNIPNAFSPDGDGMNDYFLPRELLSSGITSFKMNIYNRWGENIFTTTQIDGRGWDGKYNNQLQPMGAYVYIIEVSFNNLTRKVFQGNVTLIR
jgi:gliding motility-associated-like protein